MTLCAGVVGLSFAWMPRVVCSAAVLAAVLAAPVVVAGAGVVASGVVIGGGGGVRSLVPEHLDELLLLGACQHDAGCLLEGGFRATQGVGRKCVIPPEPSPGQATGLPLKWSLGR